MTAKESQKPYMLGNYFKVTDLPINKNFVTVF